MPQGWAGSETLSECCPGWTLLLLTSGQPPPSPAQNGCYEVPECFQLRLKMETLGGTVQVSVQSSVNTLLLPPGTARWGCPTKMHTGGAAVQWSRSSKWPAATYSKEWVISDLAQAPNRMPGEHTELDDVQAG